MREVWGGRLLRSAAGAGARSDGAWSGGAATVPMYGAAGSAELAGGGGGTIGASATERSAARSLLPPLSPPPRTR